MEARGMGGVVRFDGAVVTIEHRGVLGRLSVGKGAKAIPISQITAVQLKPAGALVNGFIQFTIPGGVENRSRFGAQTLNAAGDENSMVFTKAQQPAFEALREAVLKAMQSQNAPPMSPPASNIAEQITQLAELRDRGLITPQEFETKKTELLSRM